MLARSCRAQGGCSFEEYPYVEFREANLRTFVVDIETNFLGEFQSKVNPQSVQKELTQATKDIEHESDVSDRRSYTVTVMRMVLSLCRNWLQISVPGSRL